MGSNKSQSAFTLIELIVSMGIFALLMVFASLTLLRPQAQVSLDGVTYKLVGDTKEQQLKAMYGDTELSLPGPTASPAAYGVYFDTAGSRYVLFKGTTYSAGNAANYPVALPANVTFTSVPFTTGLVVFSRRTGEVAGFVAGQNTAIIRNSLTTQQKTITISQYGVLNVN